MAQSMEDRTAVQDALKDIENTLVAASTRLAQVQLDSMDEPEVADVAGDAMNALSPIIESIQSLSSSYQMETNRRSNEDELE